MPFPVHVHQPWVGAPPPGVCLSPAAFETLPLAPLGWPARPAGLRGYARVVQHFTRRTLCFTYRRAAACASSLPVSALHRPPAGCDHCECAPHQRAGRVSLASAPPAAHICRCQRTCCRPPAAAGGGWLHMWPFGVRAWCSRRQHAPTLGSTRLAHHPFRVAPRLTACASGHGRSPVVVSWCVLSLTVCHVVPTQ
jgi:hypothetical protein